MICRQILEAAARAKKQYGLQVKELIIEPGRSIAAEAGYTLYTVAASRILTTAGMYS